LTTQLDADWAEIDIQGAGKVCLIKGEVQWAQ
jgi:hypothetical protein